ncbi:acyltransferase family protein [Microbacterium oxydans]|uniref:acyltransferase family protein n=1 Tax=unclassified Microbacterium TaxID=2609290 RepID=UPI001430CBEF|nr:acyltransferase family protein [Microbacterium sp. ISL-59]MBT2494590.1 acyltransferase family protein [Microbacterium sp. ISL-59]NJI59684.1 acyltransferase family protein [Microbacterium sp. B19(2022)]
MTSLPGTLTHRRWGLDILRIVAIIGVVSIHTFGALRSSPELEGSRSWWVAVALNAGFIWAVPVFVMISGALLLDPRPHAAGPAAFYRQRLMRLAPAFIFWQVFYLIVVRQWMSGLDESAATMLALVLRGQPYTHLYFLWLIVGLYAIAPVLAPFLREGGRRRALVLGGVLILVTVATYSTSALLAWAGSPSPIILSALTQWLPYVGYFVAGYALRDLRLTGARMWACGAIAAAAIAWTILQAGSVDPASLLAALLPQSYLGPVTVVIALTLFVFVNSLFSGDVGTGAGRVIRTLSEATFGVYLVHFALLIAVRSVPWFADAATTSVVSAVLVWLIVVVLSFALVVPLRRVPVIGRIF